MILIARTVVATAAISILLATSVWVAAPAGAVFVCNTVKQNQTIAGNVSVPSGANCSLRGVTITGNLTATAPNQLIVVESKINGSLTVNGFQTNATVSAICSTNVGGSVALRNIPAGAAIDEAGDSDFSLGGDGGDNYTGTPVGDFTCNGVNVAGSLAVAGNHSDLGIESNTIHGSGSVTNNTGSVELTGNTFGGTLSCSGNTALDDSNVAPRATGQCA